MNIEGKKGGFIYTQAIAQARRWHGIIEVLIKRANAEEALQFQAISSRLVLPDQSVADELRKLAELHASGVLTAEEFQQQKTRLLSASPLKAD